MVNVSPEESYHKHYKELLVVWQKQKFVPLLTDRSRPIVTNSVLLDFLQFSPCVSWVFNLRSLKFELVSINTKDLFGYESELFMKKGLEFCNQIKHPEDLVGSWKLLKKVWEYIMDVPPLERRNYKFNYDYRIIKPNGKEARILEQNAVFQQDIRGNITHIVGVCNDITGWKTNDEQIASIISTTDQSVVFIHSGKTFNYPAQSIFSKRELEIIDLLAKGYSSKYIAETLSISFHTVNTHRQHMIQKVRVKNTGELIRFAIINDFI